MHLDFSYEDIPKILSHLLYLYNPCLKCVVDEFHCQELDVVQAYPEAGYCARLDTLEARLNEEFTEFRQPQNFPIPDTIIDTPEYQWERRKKRNQIRFKNGIIKLYGASRMEGIEFVQCMITGQFYPRFMVDAAHLYPHHASREDDPRNGLLIRKDIHALFDALLIGIREEGGDLYLEIGDFLRSIDFSDEESHSIKEYLLRIDGRQLVFRRNATARPWPEAVDYRYAWFKAADLYRTTSIAKEKIAEQLGVNLDLVEQWLEGIKRPARRRNPDEDECAVREGCFEAVKACFNSVIEPCQIEVFAARCDEQFGGCGHDNFFGTKEDRKDEEDDEEDEGGSIACVNCARNLVNIESFVGHGIEVMTPIGGRYQLLVAEIFGDVYQHRHKIEMVPKEGWPLEGYRYVLSVESLDSHSYEEVFKAFRLLFMGDPCIDPILGESFHRLTQPQREALRGGEDRISQKGFGPSVAAGERAGILAFPTGMGKTICALTAYDIMTEFLGRPPKLLFLAEQKEHVINGKDRFLKYIPEFGGQQNRRGGWNSPLIELAFGGKKANFSPDSLAVFATRSTLYTQLFGKQSPLKNWCPKCGAPPGKEKKNSCIEITEEGKKIQVPPHLERCVPLVNECSSCEAEPGESCKENGEIVSLFVHNEVLYRAHKTRFLSSSPMPLDYFDLVIVDECHHAGGDQYQTILNYIEPAYTLGLTATPTRADSVAIEEIFGTGGYRKGNGNIIYRMANKLGLDVAMCIREGYLTQVSYLLVNDITGQGLQGEPPRLPQGKYFVNNDEVEKKGAAPFMNFKTWKAAQSKVLIQEKVSSFITEYEKLRLKHFPNRKHPPKTLIFCGSEKTRKNQRKAHDPSEVAIKVAEYINDYYGYCVAQPFISSSKELSKFYETGGCDKTADKELLRKFKDPNSDLSFVTSVGKFDEGIDVPGIEVVVFLTRTLSSARQLQRLGRGLRLHTGKRYVHVIDLESNWSSLYQLMNDGVVRKGRRIKRTLGRGKSQKESMNSIADCHTSHNSGLVKLLESGREWKIKIRREGRTIEVSNEQIEEANERTEKGIAFDAIVEQTFGVDPTSPKFDAFYAVTNALTAEAKIEEEIPQRRYISSVLAAYLNIAETIEAANQGEILIDDYSPLLEAVARGESIIPALKAISPESFKFIDHYFPESMGLLKYRTSLSEDAVCQIIEELGLASDARILERQIRARGWDVANFTRSAIATLKEMDFASDYFHQTFEVYGGINRRIEQLRKRVNNIIAKTGKRLRRRMR